MTRRRNASATAALAVAIGLAGCSSSQAPSQSANQPTGPANIQGMFDIGGLSLYLECTGTGAPTVVLDAGLGTDHTTWANVAPDISGSNRTCTYDRANVGKSFRAPKPRTSTNVVDELHRLLEAANVPPPYVLVAHSFGGLSMRLFASTYPHDVVGLVLVDPTPPTFVHDECSIVKPDLCQRLTDDWLPTNNPEVLDLEGSARALSAAGPLPAVPMVVLAATDHMQPAVTDPRDIAAIEAVWQRRQKELAASIPTGRVQVVTSGHMIQAQHPDAVISAIRTVLAEMPPP